MGVYQAERYGTFTYSIPNLNPSGLYTVRLHFSEDADTQVGERVFNVSINGADVLSNFDILAAAGSMDTAIVEQFSATASASGQITVAFTPSAGSPDQNAKVDGIELIPVQFGNRFLTQPISIAPVEGQGFSGALATFLDTDPGGLARDYIATIAWGDGTITSGTIQPDPSGSGFDVAGVHTYTAIGDHTISIVVQSYDGAAVEISNSVAVAPDLYSIGSPKTYQATVGSSTGQIVLAVFAVGGEHPKAANFRSFIAWGDGRMTRGRVVPIRGAFLVAAHHVYASAGTYVPRVTVVLQGFAFVIDTTTIVVSPAAAIPTYPLELPPSFPSRTLLGTSPFSTVSPTSRFTPATNGAGKPRTIVGAGRGATATVPVVRQRPVRSRGADLEDLSRGLLG
jgi:hypothetical protein